MSLKKCFRILGNFRNKTISGWARKAVIGFYRIGLKTNNTVVPKNVPLQWPGTFFGFQWRWGLLEWSFPGCREHISSGNRLPMWLFPKRERDRGIAKSEKKRFFVNNMSLAWAGVIFKAIICWGLRICAGWWAATLTQSPELGNTEESRFWKKVAPPGKFFFENVYNL